MSTTSSKSKALFTAATGDTKARGLPRLRNASSNGYPRRYLVAGVATRELVNLRSQVARARTVLSRLQDKVVAADAEVAAQRALQLVEANEQLILATIRAQAEAEAVAQALTKVSRSAERRASADERARETLSSSNAALEARVVDRTAELILARDEALAAGRTKERFLSNMSHEIRTPMTGMLGALELLAQTELAPRQAEYLQVAATSGAALLAIINEVLDFATIGAGRLKVLRGPLDLAAVTHSVVTLFSAAAQSRSLELRVKLDSSLAMRRVGDSLHLRQVLLNLVGNAMKFTHQGHVEVNVTSRGGDLVRFEVADSGIGIEESQQGLIFEPFAQSDHASLPGEPSPGGTGLGLTICRDLVQAMRGSLHVDSSLGVGSSFYFDLELELEQAAPALAEPVPLAVPEQLSGSVLLVEDNVVNQMIGTAMLEALGLSVVVANDGVEALKCLAAASFAAVLMDCQMPLMDGYEATRQWRAAERARNRPRTPVIAISANAFSIDVERCLAAGMDAHLGKPFTSDGLRVILSHWMRASSHTG